VIAAKVCKLGRRVPIEKSVPLGYQCGNLLEALPRTVRNDQRVMTNNDPEVHEVVVIIEVAFWKAPDPCHRPNAFPPIVVKLGGQASLIPDHDSSPCG
jgi:hypothetical protein